MNIIHKGLLLLLRSALTGECFELPHELDLESVFSEAKRHSVLSMAYAGAVNCKIDKDLPIMKRMFGICCTEMLRSEKQMLAVKRISHALEKNNLDHMLLKGSVMKNRYPKPEMRVMGDADILIRESDYDKVRDVVEDLGFVKDNRDGDHSKNFASKDLYLELHVRFVARNELPAISEYFGDGWKKASAVDGHRYEMPVEDEMIFSFVHFFKHFVFSGVGLKHIIDLWIFLEKTPGVDLNYVEHELKKLDLLDFYKNVTNSLRVLFFDEEGDEKTSFIIEHVLECGTWGTEKTAAISRGVVARKKIGKPGGVRTYTVLKLIFPPREDLQVYYPILKKHCYLLPFVWIARWVSIVAHGRNKIAFRGRELKAISTKNINDYEEKFNLVGIRLS